MAICGGCGAPLDDKAKFCGFCGWKAPAAEGAAAPAAGTEDTQALPPEEAKTPPPPPPPPAAPVPQAPGAGKPSPPKGTPAPAKKSGKGCLILVLVLVAIGFFVLVALLGGGYYMYKKGKSLPLVDRFLHRQPAAEMTQAEGGTPQEQPPAEQPPEQQAQPEQAPEAARPDGQPSSLSGMSQEQPAPEPAPAEASPEPAPVAPPPAKPKPRPKPAPGTPAPSEQAAAPGAPEAPPAAQPTPPAAEEAPAPKVKKAGFGLIFETSAYATRLVVKADGAKIFDQALSPQGTHMRIAQELAVPAGAHHLRVAVWRAQGEPVAQEWDFTFEAGAHPVFRLDLSDNWNLTMKRLQ